MYTPEAYDDLWRAVPALLTLSEHTEYMVSTFLDAETTTNTDELSAAPQLPEVLINDNSNNMATE